MTLPIPTQPSGTRNALRGDGYAGWDAEASRVVEPAVGKSDPAVPLGGLQRRESHAL